MQAAALALAADPSIVRYRYSARFDEQGRGDPSEAVGGVGRALPRVPRGGRPARRSCVVRRGALAAFLLASSAQAPAGAADLYVFAALTSGLGVFVLSPFLANVG